MDAHELCIGGVSRRARGPYTPRTYDPPPHTLSPQPPATPTPVSQLSRVGWGGVLRVCLCVCVSVRSSLHAGVHRHPSVCLLQTPAGRHGTPCRKCGAPLPPSLKASRCMSHVNTHTHTPGLIRTVLAPDPSIKRQLAADINNLHLNNYIRHFGLDLRKKNNNNKEEVV